MKTCKGCGQLLTLECFSKKKSNKDGLNTRCKECEKARHRQYRKDNPHIQKNYKESHKEQYKEQYKQYSKQYRETHKEKIQEYDRQRKQTEKYKEQQRAYRQTETYKINNKIRSHKRRAQCKDSQGLISCEISNEVLTEWFNNRCAYSNKELSTDNINWDHIIPLHLNGANELWNLIPSYSNYNCSKGAQEPLEWYQAQEYYSNERLEYIIYYQKVMYWNFANKDSKALVLITGETITYEDIVNEYGEIE